MADVMKHFDAQCRRFGVKYSAMKDEREPGDPSYMVFYNGKSTEIIMTAMQEAYKDYLDEQKQKGQEKTGEKEIGNKGKKMREPKEPKKRESVRAKLAFFGIGLQLRNQDEKD